MSINIGGYTFEGPHSLTGALQDRSGIYAVLTSTDGKSFTVIDIGESATVKSRIEGHDREECWKRNRHGILYWAVLYTPNQPQAGRVRIEQALRAEFQPVCGIR